MLICVRILERGSNMYNTEMYDIVNIEQQIPIKEPDRQYYFIERLKEYVNKKAKELNRPLTAMVSTFGCQMNARDSEKLVGILTDIGYIEAEDEEADIVLFNTCTVRENANDKLYGRLGQLKRIKENNKDMLIGICGCMMQEEDEVARIKKSYRYVDIVFGTHNIYKLAEILYNRLAKKEQVVDVLEKADKIVENLPNKRVYSFKTGVNIMFGCNNYCTYCIVPYVRGKERSREPEEIIEEIKKHVADGVIEIMLLGQNVNSYGKNLDKKVSFAALLEKVCKIDGLKRVRFMTSHPKDLSDELIQVMKNEEKICRHLHLPLQSGSTKVLKRMNRVYTKESYLELALKIKKEIPDIGLTTDIIVGFPGETEEDFLETLEVVDKVRYDSAFTFIYSKRSGTPAANMEDQIDPLVVKDRFNRLLKMVQTHSTEAALKNVGEVKEALVESKNTHLDNYVSARLSNNMIVHFKADESLIGKIVKVRLDEAKGFYYLGHMLE